MFVEIRGLAVILFMTLHVYPSDAGKLAAPQNVKITSINMGAVVEWQYRHNSLSNVTYTTRYILRNTYTYICNNSKELKCDAGQLSVFGKYTFQVRAEHQGRFTKWVNAGVLTPSTHTIIGPPTVHLIIKNNILDVHVQDPVLKVGRLRDVYFQVSYVVKYWIDGLEESLREKKINNDNKENMKMSIKELSSWSRYCVQVRVVLKGNRNETPFSPAVCVLNIPVLTSCVIAAAVLLPLVLLSSWFIYKVKAFLYPETELPDRFSKFEAIQHTSNQKEQLDKISAISEDHLYDGPDEKAKILEDTCCLEMEDDYKHLMQTIPAPTFFPNHLYPLCLKNKLNTHLNQPGFESSIGIQSFYYNEANLNVKHNNVFEVTAS